jgi:tRNA(Ile)-lysidine synthase
MLRTRVRNFIEERGLLQPGDRVVMGVSGGPDSLCLLDVLHALAAEWGWTLHVAHLNHGLRPEAAAEAEFVRAEADRRGLPFHTETLDTRAHAAASRQTLEEAARALRYAFLARVESRLGSAVVAVAHTADDQAETVLMHFLRGAGMAGLRGMRAKSQLPTPNAQTRAALIRPLLNVTRAEIEAYCAEHGLQPLRDASNQDTTFFRNRLRHELLPLLETYNPRIREVLRRTAEVMAGEYALLSRQRDDVWRDIAHIEEGRITFDKARWRALSLPEQCALLREAVRALRSNLRDVDFTPIERAARFSQTAQAGRACDVVGGLCLSVSAQTLILHLWDAHPPTADAPQLLAGGALAPGWTFQVVALNVGEWSWAEIESNPNRWRVFVDAESLPLSRKGTGGWGLRARLPGDRFRPLGLSGHHMKLSDFFVNAKVDKALRGRWPLVVCGDEIIWVAGLRLDERFRVKPGTATVVRLEFIKIDGGPLHGTNDET